MIIIEKNEYEQTDEAEEKVFYRQESVAFSASPG